MKLRDLKARLIHYEERPASTFEHFTIEELKAGGYPEGKIDRLYVPVQTLAEADGVRFQCPKCKAAGQFAHPIFIGFAGIAVEGTYGYNKAGMPVTWQMSGTGLDDLVLFPSIQIQGGCNWHGFVGSSGVPPGEAA